MLFVRVRARYRVFQYKCRMWRLGCCCFVIRIKVCMFSGVLGSLVGYFGMYRQFFCFFVKFFCVGQILVGQGDEWSKSRRLIRDVCLYKFCCYLKVLRVLESCEGSRKGIGRVVQRRSCFYFFRYFVDLFFRGGGDQQFRQECFFFRLK